MKKRFETLAPGATWRDNGKALVLSSLYGAAGLAFFHGLGNALQLMA